MPVEVFKHGSIFHLIKIAPNVQITAEKGNEVEGRPPFEQGE